jgi:3-carboxy-cis,cis-muconate cycloisomerase
MTVNPADSDIFGALFGDAEMRTLFSDRRRLQAMLDVEAALARAEASLGIVPQDVAEAVTRAASVDRLSLTDLAESTRLVGYPVAGLVKELGKAAGPEAARYIHWGATTQDIVDTSLVLQIRDGLDMVERNLAAIGLALADTAERHRETLMAGRTHLQHALPVTFGYKCAIWLAPLVSHAERLAELRRRVLVVQFGGAVGTLASLGTQGRAVTEALARELGLAVPVAPWHVVRDGLVETACFLGLVCGSLAKFATDIVLLMQTEIAEACEPHQPGRGGSSTMPQKRNPIASEYILAAARGVHALVPVMLGAMVQDHERATGPWQSEQLALPQIFVLTSGALMHSAFLAKGLTVDAAQMRANLDVTQGLILSEAIMMALASTIGRDKAHHVLQHASDVALKEQRHIADVLAEDADVSRHLDRAAIGTLTDPANYLGEAYAVVDRVVAEARQAFSGTGVQ